VLSYPWVTIDIPLIIYRIPQFVGIDGHRGTSESETLEGRGEDKEQLHWKACLIFLKVWNIIRTLVTTQQNWSEKLWKKKSFSLVSLSWWLHPSVSFHVCASCFSANLQTGGKRKIEKFKYSFSHSVVWLPVHGCNNSGKDFLD